MNVTKSETYNKYNDGGEEITALYSRLSCDDDLQGDSNSIKNKIDKMLFTLNLFICFYFIIYLQSLHDNLVISAAIL